MKNIYITYDACYNWGQRTKDVIRIGARDAVADNLMSDDPKKKYTETIESLLRSIEHINGRKYIPGTAKCVGEQEPVIHYTRNEMKTNSRKEIIHFVCDYSVVKLGTNPNKIKKKKKDMINIPVNINSLLPYSYWADEAELPIDELHHVIVMLEHLKGNKVLRDEGFSVGLIDDDVYNEVFG